MACALQFADQPGEGLRHATIALDKMKAARRMIELRLEPLDERIQAGDVEVWIMG